METGLTGVALECSYGLAHARRAGLLMLVGKTGLRARVM